MTNSSGASFIQNVKLTIKDANDAPLGVQMSEHTVSEDAKSGTVVGTLTAIDADQNDSHTFILVNSEGKEVDDPRFVIQDNSLIVRADGVLDYEGHSIETVNVRDEDSAGAIYTEQLTIGVSDVVEQSSEYEEDGPPVIIVIDDSVEILPETFTTADWHVTDDFAQAVSTTITTESYSTVDSVWSETSFYTEYGAEYETTWVTETTTWYE
ncbi:MAG: cadherin repeat domain-containing protein, partial [Planctomyces sp.]